MRNKWGLTSLMLALSVVVYLSVGKFADFITANLIGPTGTEIENLRIITSNDISTINNSTDNLSINFDLSFDDNPGNVMLDGLMIEMVFPNDITLSNNAIINHGDGVQFDQIQNVPVDGGQKIIITFYNLHLRRSAQLFTFSTNTAKISRDFNVRTSGEVLTDGAQKYILSPFDYSISAPQQSSNSGSNSNEKVSGGGGGGGSDGVPRKQKVAQTQPSALVSDDHAICSIDYTSPFVDLDNHFSHKPVNFLYNFNVVNGYANNLFKPDQNIIRAEVTKMVVATFKKDVVSTGDVIANPKFPDIYKKDWYAKYINVADSYGIVTGYKDGLFRPVKKMSRAEALKVMMLAAGWTMTNEYPSSFPDVKKDSWYYDAVNYAYNSGIINGYLNGNFGPDDPVTRGQAAVILKNIICSKKTVLPKEFTNQTTTAWIK